MQFDDEDDEKDDILKSLSGEVDDYAGSQLEDPNKKKEGVTITIAVIPNGQPEKKEEEGEDKEGNMEAGNEEHDPIAHILGMCGGGCPE